MASAEVRPPVRSQEPGPSTTVLFGAGAISASGRRLPPRSPRSFGPTAEPVGECTPRRCHEPGQACATRGASKTSCVTSPDAVTGRRSAGVWRVSVEAVARVIQAYVPEQLGEARLKGLFRTGFVLRSRARLAPLPEQETTLRPVLPTLRGVRAVPTGDRCDIVNSPSPVALCGRLISHRGASWHGGGRPASNAKNREV